MTGSEYERKRRFDDTPEPPSTVIATDVDPFTAPTGDQFVIQQHYATRLHHDLRLEMHNDEASVLVSWAIPKGLPREKGERALAIHTEDHPMEYATFAGAIPEGNYGAGEVRIFDGGSYEMVGRSDERITFRLEGERLRGVYHLVRTGSEGGQEQWLALLSEDHRPPRAQPPPPQPMLATLAPAPFDDPAWAFEPKWDGIRAIAVCGTHTSLISRNGRDVTAAYPELHSIHDRVVALDAILDGEIVAFEEGRPSFQRLQQRMHVRDARRIERLAETIPVALMVFDLLYLDGANLTESDFTERRGRLEKIIVPSENVQLSPVIEGAGTVLFQAVSDQGLEGIVAKRLTSTYEPGGRSRSWLKVKVTFDVDVVVVGWTTGEGRRAASLGSLIMAVYDQGKLRYVGNVGTGFDKHSLADALERLERLDEREPAFEVDVLRGNPELRGARWVAPVLVARVEHRQLTDAGKLRAPSFQGFREDKEPEECTFDQLVPEQELPPS